MIAILAWMLVILGIAGTGWGVQLAFVSASGRAWAGALVAPLGLMVAFSGAVLLFVPRFFG
jgi:hypothetical protein